jgi:hypothetical protein
MERFKVVVSRVAVSLQVMRKDGTEAHQEVTEAANSNGGISFPTVLSRSVINWQSIGNEFACCHFRMPRVVVRRILFEPSLENYG